MACAHDHANAQPDDPEGDSLFRFIDTTGVRCLNERVAGSGVNCIKPFAKKAEAEPCVESNEVRRADAVSPRAARTIRTDARFTL